MKFSKLALYFDQIDKTASRLQITKFLAELFHKLDLKEIDKTIYLLSGRVTPLYERTEFGMAEKMIIRAVIAACGLKKEAFMSSYKKSGDIGATVKKFKEETPSLEKKDLSIEEVYGGLYKLATASGKGSQDEKIQILALLIRQLDPLSSLYLVRIPAGAMRMGFSDMTVLDGFSWMLKGDKSLRSQIEKAYHVRPDLGLIGKILKEKGLEGLNKVKPALFTPIIMMRAERLSSAKEIIEKIGACAVEPKYDGFRLQAHYSKDKNEVRLYSRNLEEVSFMYPDIIEGIKKEVKAKEIIFEGEAIGFDPNTGSFLPFQETVQRKRKYDIEEKSKEIPLKFFAFEILYVDGESYLEIPFSQRRKKLENSIKVVGDIFKDTIMLAPDSIIGEEKKLELMFDDAVSKGLEGVVVKKPKGVYQAGARGWNWIKYKRSYSSKIEDTIDCLVMGYDLGKGKRADFGIGAFLTGIYDEKKDKYFTIAKIGTGLLDEEWKEMKKRGDKHKSDSKPALYVVDKMMEVDVWVKPAIVVEIRADEITRSPVHTAGRVLKASKSGKAFEVDVPGFALRFPRLEKFRDDKRPEDVTTLKEVEKLYKSRV